MPGDKGLKGLWGKLFGRQRPQTPAEAWVAVREQASPEEVIKQYFDAVAAHDLDWILATLTPERAKLYADPRTVDRRRQSVRAVQVTRMESAHLPTLPTVAAQRYHDHLVLRVEYDMELAEERRDPTMQAGQQWSYFLLVRERAGKPWMIADWGRE